MANVTSPILLSPRPVLTYHCQDRYKLYGVSWWARKVHSIIYVSLETFSPPQWSRKTEEGELITVFYFKDPMPRVPTKQQKEVLTVLGGQENLSSR